MSFEKKHISIRVPWHDTGWDGRVCEKPRLNGACLKLKGIAQEKDDAAEEEVAGRSFQDIPMEQWPCCVAERVGFMAPFEYAIDVNHPYKHSSRGSHGHFASTTLRYPAYSAAAIPFAWMLEEQMAYLAEVFHLDVQPEREPDLGFKTNWIQERKNQKELLDCFRNHIKPEESLCFFYAKHVPFVEDSGTRRIIIGVGRVLHISKCVEYQYTTKNLDGKLRSMLWELMVQHSIRPDFKDGFILPYHKAIKLAEKDPLFDPASIVAFSPEDRILEFSHVSQLVTHDAAISGLLSCAESLRKVGGIIKGPWKRCLTWIDRRLGELWKSRGPCPGLGAALCAFGIDLGTFVARSIAEKVGENEDPWPLVDKTLRQPEEYLAKNLAKGVDATIQEKWKCLPKRRRALLELISRFEISHGQAETIYIKEEREAADIHISDRDILANPYLIYESTRLSEDPISVWTVDRGIFPDETIRKKHPLPKPSVLNAGTDARRVRALSVKVLEDSASSGNTLMPQDQVVLAIRNLEIQPGCKVDGDLMEIVKNSFDDLIVETPLKDENPAFQLGRLREVGNIIRNAVRKRIKGKVLSVDANWRTLLDKHLKKHGSAGFDELEEHARVEKSAALEELSRRRLSVLIGKAGTGKTTLLSVLCSHPDIAKGEILLLAPTGKARVRMEQSTQELNLKGLTVAQFLSPDRYHAFTGRYALSDKPGRAGAKTVIVDEASMLTEEMLAALIQALRGVHRLILIGDPRQLPPIGAGRPFVDIVKRLEPEGVSEKFPRIGPGYAELTVSRRHTGVEREDLQLAEWFSGSPIAPGEDDIFDKVVHTGCGKHVRFVKWESADELREKLVGVLIEELQLNGSEDVKTFDESLGGVDWKGMMRFFNLGSAKKSENWQILSPVRSGPHGVPDLNRFIHKKFRQEMVLESREKWSKFTKPMGPEEIVYGDKVINLVNTNPKLPWFLHRKVYPEKDNPYIANGEIGMAVGFFRKKGLPDFRWKLEVEFSSQPLHKYAFTNRDFGEEANPILELAYALTVHKSQGSEFGTVMLVLPNPCRLLSRELLYTALTRQKEGIVILHQGGRGDLRKFSSDDQSETARRLTNLFEVPSPVSINGRLYEENLIHRTSRGEMVRSKSEVIIADRLADLDVEYLYETPLTIDGSTKFPDFTIEDAESGETFFWEHCGMLHVPNYRNRWEQKLAWYKANGILPYKDGGGENGTLIITSESEKGGISSQEIKNIIQTVILE